MAYWRLHYHLVWATFKRDPILTKDREKITYGTLYNKAKELGLIIHAAGNVEDHIHVVVSIPPKLSISDCMRHLKGASAHAVNYTLPSASVFKWQEGYGVLSIGERSLPTLIAYANNQRQHHQSGTTIALYERMAEEDDGPIIERML